MFVFSTFRLDVVNASLRRGKQAVLLTPKAFYVLRHLVEHAGQLVTKDDLWRAAWPGISVTDASLTMCVSEIRKALGDDPKTPRYIETVHRLGYRFITPVLTQPVRRSDSGLRSQDGALVNSPPQRTPTAHFVGREAELARLREFLERALEGERQIIFMPGEPGIGKAALVEEFLQQVQVAAGNSLWIGRGQCIEHYGAGEAYLPVLDALARLCRQPGSEPLLELLDKHAPAWLAQMPGLLDATQWRALQRRAAGATRERMLRELSDAMEVISRERPLVLQLEDLHWSDYSTLEWLDFLARRQEPARVMVLATYRPVEVIVREHPLKNLKHELQIHGQCKELPVSLLSEAAVMEYVTRRIASSDPFVDQDSREGRSHESIRGLAHTIYQRTDGNPLFMVNVVNYLAEREVLDTLGNAAAAQSKATATLGPDAIDMPPSIVQMIERNLERLNPDEQAVLEAASVAGAEFPAAAVAVALCSPIDDIEACCTRLARQQQFIQAIGSGEWPDGTVAARFQFLHNVYRDILHERVPPGRRVELHRRIAEREEQAYGDNIGEVAVELAYHFRLGGNRAKTVKYFGLAAERATARLAYHEAEQHYRDAIEALSRLPEGPERLQSELLLQLGLGTVLIPAKGWAAPEVPKAFRRVQELAEQLGNAALVFRALVGLWSVHQIRGDMRAAYAFAEQAFRIAQNTQDSTQLLLAHVAMGGALLGKGEFLLSRGHSEAAISLYEPERHGPWVLRASVDMKVICLANLGIVLWMLGYPDEGLKRANEAVQFARGLPHLHSAANAELFLAAVHQCRREARAAQRDCRPSERAMCRARLHDVVGSRESRTGLVDRRTRTPRRRDRTD